MVQVCEVEGRPFGWEEEHHAPRNGIPFFLVEVLLQLGQHRLVVSLLGSHFLRLLGIVLDQFDRFFGKTLA